VTKSILFGGYRAFADVYLRLPAAGNAWHEKPGAFDLSGFSTPVAK